VSGDGRDDWSTMPPAPGLDESDSVSGRFVAIFPNVLLSVLPNHACFTAAAYEGYHVVAGGHEVEAEWPRVNGW
jgi:hypothetical protein